MEDLSLENWPGSKWWKFDFHSHTPCSSDYDSSERETLSCRDWLLAYMRAEIDCVAVTDHNSGGWINQLQSELVQMKEQELIEGYRPLVIYPGVELTSSDGIHIIGIFNPAFKSEKIHRLSSLVDLSENGVNAEKICGKGSLEVCKAIRSENGVVVLAHAEECKGVLESRNNNDSESYEPRHEIRQIRQLIDKCDAIEMHDKGCSAASHFSEDIKSKAIVSGSDSHKSTTAGDRYTWIKMSNPDIEGLKLALIDPESSVIRIDEISHNPNLPPSQRIKSLFIDQLCLRRESPLSLEFSPWLNSLIGGRGSGKSTLIESLRLALSRDNEIESLGSDSEVFRSFQRFKNIRANRHDIGMLRNNTQLTAVVEADESGVTETYKYNWKNDSFEVFRLNDEQAWELTALEQKQARERFPVKIFSQKQIFELSDRPQAILDFIDDSLGLDLGTWQETRESLQKSLKDLRHEERELINKLSSRAELEVEKKEISRKVRVFQQSGLAEEVKHFQNNRSSKQALDEFINNSQSTIEKITADVGSDNPFSKLRLNELKTEVSSIEVKKASAAYIENLEKAFDEILKNLTSMTTALENFKSHNEIVKFDKSLEDQLNQYREKIEGLKAEGIASTQDAEKNLARQAEIEKQLKELIEKEQDLKSIRKQILIGYVKLVRHRRKLTKYRQCFIDKVLENVGNLKIEMIPFSDLDASVNEFRRVLRLQDNTFVDEVLGDVGDDGGRYGLLGRLISSGIQTPTHRRISELKLGILNKDEEILGEKLHGKLLNALERMSDEDKDNLIEWFPEDLVKIEFRRNENDQFQSLRSASAGQKTSTILSFILHHGNEPLILDQPEDDLDNSLISSLLVTNLRKSKVRRQVIVVTHNPNIVVNGDAELVLPMEFAGGQIQLNLSGGLQEEKIRRKICEVMEGGEEAFRQRYKRILEDLDARTN